MLLKIKHLSIFLFLFGFQMIAALQANGECTCELLTQSEENDQKVVAMAQEIESSFNNNSVDGFNDNFDLDSFKSLIINNIDISSNNAYIEGFLDGVGDAGNKLATKILFEIQNGAYYNLINFQYNIIEKAYYFTFRIYSETTGINYHDYKVCSNGEEIRVNDIYIYLSGEHISETLNRLLKMSLEDENNNTYDSEESMVSSITRVINAQKLAQEGKPKEAYKEINAITGPLKKEKFFLLLKALFASAYDDKIYEDILSEFADLYPNDPTLYLKMIDYYFLKENYKMTHIYIDKLMFETDDDFLYLMKARAYMLQEDYANAEKHFNYIKRNYPSNFEAYIGEMISLTFLNRLEDTLAIAQSLVDLGYDKEELTVYFEEKEPDGSNTLESFVESDIYKEWKQKS